APATAPWKTLVEVPREANLREEARASHAGRGAPAWLWPVAAAVLVILVGAVGWKLSIDSRTPQRDVGPTGPVASSPPPKARPPAPETRATEANHPRAGTQTALSPPSSTPVTPPPPARESTIASSLGSASPERVEEAPREEGNATEKEAEPADIRPTLPPTRT